MEAALSGLSAEINSLASLLPTERVRRLVALSKEAGFSSEPLAVSAIVEVLTAGLGDSSDRVILGEVLGELGDPRLLSPSDEQYWASVPTDDGTIVIARYPVTNAEYKRWVDSGAYENRAFWSEQGWKWLAQAKSPWPVSAAQEGAEPFIVANQPVVGVTYFEAMAYAKAHKARLPRPDERLHVYRGTEKRPYPWGSPFGEGNANTEEEALGRPCAIGLFPQDCTPEGVYDLAGNVAEWTFQEPSDEEIRQVLVHPGAWDQPSMAAWAKAKDYQDPDARWASLGFRLARGS